MNQADAERAMAERWSLGCKIIRVARDHAAGYLRNISQFNTGHENETADRCANAASNTAWFILKALGYSDDEMKRMKNDAMGIGAPAPTAGEEK